VDERTAAALDQFGRALEELGWVRALLVAGSLATGDYSPGVSDLDLVAVTDCPVDVASTERLTSIHRDLDVGAARGLDLGCVYVAAGALADPAAVHPTWTHGQLVQRILSGVTRAELVRHGYAVLGSAPRDLLPAMNADDVRAAGRAEVTGYWAWASRRPWMWLDPVIADLGLTSMARARHTLATGELLTKSEAIERAAAPLACAPPGSRGGTPAAPCGMRPEADDPPEQSGRVTLLWGDGSGQKATVPLQTSPAYVARNVIESVPARSAIWRSTLNEPLRPPVVDVPEEALAPLSTIFQCQAWPAALLSTSPSTSMRPSSDLAFTFHRAPSVQLPVFVTRPPSPPPCEAKAGLAVSTRAEVARPARASLGIVMATACGAPVRQR